LYSASIQTVALDKAKSLSIQYLINQPIFDVSNVGTKLLST